MALDATRAAALPAIVVLVAVTFFNALNLPVVLNRIASMLPPADGRADAPLVWAAGLETSLGMACAQLCALYLAARRLAADRLAAMLAQLRPLMALGSLLMGVGVVARVAGDGLPRESVRDLIVVGAFAVQALCVGLLSGLVHVTVTVDIVRDPDAPLSRRGLVYSTLLYAALLCGGLQVEGTEAMVQFEGNPATRLLGVPLQDDVDVGALGGGGALCIALAHLAAMAARGRAAPAPAVELVPADGQLSHCLCAEAPARGAPSGAGRI